MALTPTSVSEPFLYLFGVKMRFFEIFCTSGFDIQEITLTYTFSTSCLRRILAAPRQSKQASSALGLHNICPNEWLYLLEC